MKNRPMNPVERAEAELAALTQGQQSMNGQQNPSEPAEGTPAAAAEPTVPSQPAPQTPPEPAEGNEDFRQKYFALQGMFNGQKQQLADLIKQNDRLIDQVELLSTQLMNPVAAPQQGAAPGEHAQHLQALVAEYGEPMLEAIKLIADATFGGRIAELEQRLNGINSLSEKVNAVEERQTKSDSEKFQEALTNRMPDWLAVYSSDQFNVWKSTAVEPFTTRTYGELFEEANKKWNLDGILGIFNAYKVANGIAPGVPQTNNQPHEQSPQQRDPRESLVTPGSRGAGAAGASDQPKVWKQSEVDAVFSNMRRGRYTQEELARLDREIMEANAQGRIVPG